MSDETNVETISYTWSVVFYGYKITVYHRYIIICIYNIRHNLASANILSVC